MEELSAGTEVQYVGTKLPLAQWSGAGSGTAVNGSKAEALLNWCECPWLCTCVLTPAGSSRRAKAEWLGSVTVGLLNTALLWEEYLALAELEMKVCDRLYGAALYSHYILRNTVSSFVSFHFSL